jgi:hypothetical protein
MRPGSRWMGVSCADLRGAVPEDAVTAETGDHQIGRPEVHADTLRRAVGRCRGTTSCRGCSRDGGPAPRSSDGGRWWRWRWSWDVVFLVHDTAMPGKSRTPVLMTSDRASDGFRGDFRWAGLSCPAPTCRFGYRIAPWRLCQVAGPCLPHGLSRCREEPDESGAGIQGHSAAAVVISRTFGLPPHLSYTRW